MGLMEFEPILAKYYPKIKNTAGNEIQASQFRCAAFAPKEVNRVSIVRGLVTDTTKRVIKTTDKTIIFERGGVVEIFGEKLKITQLVTDETDTDILGYMKFNTDYIKKGLPKWMVLE